MIHSVKQVLVWIQEMWIQIQRYCHSQISFGFREQKPIQTSFTKKGWIYWRYMRVSSRIQEQKLWLLTVLSQMTLTVSLEANHRCFSLHICSSPPLPTPPFPFSFCFTMHMLAQALALTLFLIFSIQQKLTWFSSSILILASSVQIRHVPLIQSILAKGLGSWGHRSWW